MQPRQNPDTHLWFGARPRRAGRRKPQFVTHPRHGRICVAILHRNRCNRQPPERDLDQGTKCLARQSSSARRAHEHDADLEAADVRSGPDRAQADGLAAVTFHDDEESRPGGFSGCIDRSAQTCRGSHARKRTADVAHRFGVAIQKPEELPVIPRKRTQAHARSHAPVRASFASRRNAFASGINFRAGGKTSVSGASMRAAASLRNASRSIRGAWIGSVAARYMMTL